VEYTSEDAAGLIQNKVSHGDCANLGGNVGCPSESKLDPAFQKVAMPQKKSRSVLNGSGIRLGAMPSRGNQDSISDFAGRSTRAGGYESS